MTETRLPVKAHEPFHIKHRNFIVGLFVAVPLLCIPVFIIFTLIKIDYFEKWTTLYVRYDTGSGLENGTTPVTVHGIKVGHVQKVDLNPNGWVDVEFLVKQQYQGMIKKDSKALLKQKNLVIGDWSIDLSTGTEFAPCAMSGDTLESEIPIQLDKMLGDVAGLVKTIDSIAGDIQNGKGTIGRLLKNDSLLIAIDKLMNNADRVMVHANRTLSHADTLLVVFSGLGLGGTTIVDSVALLTERIGVLLGSIDTLVTNLHSVAGEVPDMVQGIEKTVNNANTIFRSLEYNWLIKRALTKAQKNDSTIRLEK